MIVDDKYLMINNIRGESFLYFIITASYNSLLIITHAICNKGWRLMDRSI